MRSLRLLISALPLVLTGCSTMSSVHWSSALPWNWFDSPAVVSEQGVAGIKSSTPMDETAIRRGLSSEYRLRSGMKTAKGDVVPYFEALKENKVMLVINGDRGSVSRIDVMDSAIASEQGVKIGTKFGDLYKKAFGVCDQGQGEDTGLVVCKAPDSSHIYYAFYGTWSGPDGLMPSDDSLKAWKLTKIIWQR